MEGRREVALEEQEAEKGKLDAKTQEVADTNDRIKELETEIADAKAKIAEFGNIEQLITLIDQLQTDLFTAKNEIANLEGSLAASKTQEERTADRIQAIKDLEFRQRNGQMVSINANISSVYNTWGFVVLGAGDRQGVVSRTKLDVKRGGEKIAELIVTNLEKNRSVCDIVPGSMQPGQMLRPGDRVTVSPDSMPKPKSQTPESRPPVVVLPSQTPHQEKLALRLMTGWMLSTRLPPQTPAIRSAISAPLLKIQLQLKPKLLPLTIHSAISNSRSTSPPYIPSQPCYRP